MRHVIEAQQFSVDFLRQICQRAKQLEEGGGDVLRGKILASLFYEPSTRTRLSFESAMLKLGGQVVSTENAKEFSSAVKGETLEDSIRVVSNYADVVVLRHFDDDAAARAAAVSTVPVINAGSGAGQHPTQALLDMYTIWRELGRLEQLTVALVGDLRHGRTIRSLAYLLAKYPGATLYFIAPPQLTVGRDILAYLDRHGVAYKEFGALEPLLGSVDVVYQTRLQRERFSDPNLYQQVRGVFQITKKMAEQMRPGAIIMHPLPRVDEIVAEVDTMPQAAYFRQARYGLYARMALLEWVLSPETRS